MRELRVFKCRSGALAYSPDGSVLASGGQHRQVKLWSPASGKEIATLQPPPAALFADEMLNRVIFSRDGARVAASGNRFFLVWDTATGTSLSAGLVNGLGCSVAFFPDGQRLAVGCNHVWVGEGLRGWNISTSTFESVFGPPSYSVSAVTTSRGGGLLAVAVQVTGRAVWTNWVRLWDFAAGRWRSAVDLDKKQSLAVRALALSPDEQLLATATARFASLWDVVTGQRRQRLPDQPDLVTTVCFSPDGGVLATGCKDGRVRLWDVASGRERAAFDWQTGTVRGVAFSPDGMTAAVVGDRHKIVLWDVDL